MTGLLARLGRPPNPAERPDVAKRLAAADRLIDLAWSVAVLWAVLRLAAALWLWRNTDGGEAAWFADPLLIGALAYGLYRRSRVCAVVLLGYVVVELWLAYHSRGPAAGVTVAFVLGITFVQGIRGTVLHHRERIRAGDD
jgi:hypothetical protein